jgi:alkaline phosphatase D
MHVILAEGDFGTRKAAAMRAYHEWMPTRVFDYTSEYNRTHQFGDLATLIMMETRLTARTSQASLPAARA